MIQFTVPFEQAIKEGEEEEEEEQNIDEVLQIQPERIPEVIRGCCVRIFFVLVVISLI